LADIYYAKTTLKGRKIVDSIARVAAAAHLPQHASQGLVQISAADQAAPEQLAKLRTV
jgi:hypothetical protein